MEMMGSEFTQSFLGQLCCLLFLELLTQNIVRGQNPSANFILLVHMAKSLSFGMHPLILDFYHSVKSDLLLIFM